MRITDFPKKKQSGQKITFLTCYDYPSAKIIAETDIDCVLVGDSVAMTVHGHDNTINATIEMMALHTKAVARGIQQQLIVTDLPFLCHKKSLADTVDNVKTLMQAGAHAIKIEGGDEDTCASIHHLVSAGVPIMGHIGLTPQSVHQLGGFKVQGKETHEAEKLLEQALSLQAAGCFALVLECVPQAVAACITQHLNIPTIGIGAGAMTDGQVLVWHDLLGLQTQLKPKFVKQYLEAKPLLEKAINAYACEVKQSLFPSVTHAF